MVFILHYLGGAEPKSLHMLSVCTGVLFCFGLSFSPINLVLVESTDAGAMTVEERL